MHVSKIDFNLFVVFKAIYDRQSITRAAEQLNLSQPAVSHALSRLREIVNDPLFVRSGQRITPTAIAHKLIGPARTALVSLEQAISQLHQFDPSKAELAFSIGVNPLFEGALIAPLMKSISAKAPGIRLSSVRLERDLMDRSLARGAIDLAIDVGVVTGKLLRKARILSSPIIVVSRAGNPALRAGKAIAFQEYMDQQHVMVSSRTRGLGFEDLLIARSSNLQRQIYCRCQHIDTALDLVRHTNSLLTAPKVLVDVGTANDDLVVFDPPFECPDAQIYAYWHANSENENPASWLRQALLKACSQHVSPPTKRRQTR